MLMSRLAFGSLLLLVFSLPLEDTTVSPQFGTLSRLIGGVALLFAALAILDRWHLRKFNLAIGLVIIFLWWNAVSYFWSISPGDTTDKLSTYIQLFLFFLVVINLVDDEKKQRYILYAFVLGTIVAASLILKNYLIGSAYSAMFDRYSVTNTNPNRIVLSFVLSIPICWYIEQKTPRRAVKLAAYMLVVLFIICTLLTGSRTGLITSGVALTIFLAQSRGFNLRRFIMLLIGVAILLEIASAVVPQTVIDRLASIDNQGTIDFNSRNLYWEIGVQRWWDASPVLGFGLGGYRAVVGSVLFYQQGAHNTFLQILVETGIIGIIIYTVMLATIISPLLKQPPLEAILWIGLFVTWFVHSLASGNTDSKITWLLYSLAIAWQYNASAKKPPENDVGYKTARRSITRSYEKDPNYS